MDDDGWISNPMNPSRTPSKLPTTCAEEWYDVKGAMRSLSPSATNPNPFKADEPRSPLRDLLTGDDTRYIRIDPAHTFAIDGIGKDFLASTIVMLVRMWHFGRGNAGHALQNAYASFMAYCSARKKSTSIQDFNFATLKLPQNSFLSVLGCAILTLILLIPKRSIVYYLIVARDLAITPGQNIPHSNSLEPSTDQAKVERFPTRSGKRT